MSSLILLVEETNADFILVVLYMITSKRTQNIVAILDNSNSVYSLPHLCVLIVLFELYGG